MCLCDYFVSMLVVVRRRDEEICFRELWNVWLETKWRARSPVLWQSQSG